jgi:hypothetical protein
MNCLTSKAQARPILAMMLSEIFMKGLAALALEQSVKVHVGTKSFRETGTVCFA